MLTAAGVDITQLPGLAQPAAATVDLSASTGAPPPPLVRTTSQARAVFQRVAGGGLGLTAALEISTVRVVYKSVTKPIDVSKLSTAGELLASAIEAFVPHFKDDFERRGQFDLWLPPPIGPRWLERDGALNASHTVQAMQSGAVLALGNSAETPSGPAWGRSLPPSAAAASPMVSPRDTAKKRVEAMLRRSLFTSSRSRSSSPAARAAEPAAAADAVDAGGRPTTPVRPTARPTGSPQVPPRGRTLLRTLSKAKQSPPPLKRQVSRPVEVTRPGTNTLSNKESKLGGMSSGMSEIRGHVYLNINALDDSAMWRKCWLLSEDSKFEYNYVEDDFLPRAKDENDVEAVRLLVDKARPLCASDAIVTQRLDELAAVLADVTQKLAALTDSNAPDRRRLLGLQRNVCNELRTIGQDTLRRFAPASSAPARAGADVDGETKTIPLSAVRRVEFKPAPSSTFDFCLHVAHSRRTGDVLGSGGGGGGGGASASQLRASVGAADATPVAATAADEYTVPFYVRADNRQNRMMWIWGLDILFSRRGLGTHAAPALSRIAILYEIYMTEKQYVMRLDELIVEWMLPLVNSKTLTESESAHLFGNLERLLEANQRLLSAMTTRFEQELWNPETSLIGDVWLAAFPSLQIYKAYGVTFVSASAAIKRLLRDNKNFRDFHDARPGVLDSAMIAPVQRVPRYMLLFKDLLDKTPTGHPDRVMVAECLERFTTLANDVNRSVRDHESRSAMAEISQQLIDLPPGLITRPGLVFIRQGVVRRVTTRLTVTTLLLLFDEFLVYAQHDLVGKEWRYKGVIELPYAWLRDLTDTDNVKNGFHLVTPHKTYLFLAKSDSEKVLWMRDLTGVIDAYLDRHPQHNEFRQVAKVQMRKKTGLWRLLTKDLAAEVEMAEKSRSQDSVRDEQPLQITVTPLSAVVSAAAAAAASVGAGSSPGAGGAFVSAVPLTASTSSSSGSAGVLGVHRAVPAPAATATSSSAASTAATTTTTTTTTTAAASERRRSSMLLAGDLDFEKPSRGASGDRGSKKMRSGSPMMTLRDGGHSIEIASSYDGSSIGTEDDDERLYLIKHAPSLDRSMVRRIEPALASLARNASFVLISDSVCVWHGDEATAPDRQRAHEFARAMSVVTAASQTDTEPQAATPPTRRRRIVGARAFFRALSAIDPDAPPLDAAGAFQPTRRLDDMRLVDLLQNIKLFQIREAGVERPTQPVERSVSRRRNTDVIVAPSASSSIDNIEMLLVDTETLSRQHLNSHHMYVLDADTTTFVWAGAKASDTERIWAMLKAEQLQQGRSKIGEVEWVDDVAETALFVAQFASWPLFDDDDESLVARILGKRADDESDDVVDE
jgi:hypothetical protein